MAEKPTYEELGQRVKELEKEASKRKRAEMEARLMQHCVDNTCDAVFWVDNKARFTYVNKAACRHMGYSREEMLSMDVYSVDPLYQKDNWPDFWHEFKEKGSLLFESINRSKDGREFPVEITVNYLEHEGKEIMHAYARDITERKRGAEALQEAHDQLEQKVQERTAELTDANERLKLEIDQRKQAEEALQKAHNELEIRVEERTVELLEKQSTLRNQNISLVKKSIELSDVMRELEDKNYDLELIRSDLQKALEALRQAHEGLEQRVDERTAELTKANERLNLEIDQRKRAEERIKKQNEFLETVIESIPHPFYVVDATNYSIVMANSLTAPNDAWKGSTCHSLTHHRATPCDGKEHLCPLQEVKLAGNPAVLEHIHFDKEGRKRNVEVHGYPIFDGNGNIIQMIELSIDITTRKEMEKEREQLIVELQEALSKVKTLSGFLPICASCKKIRDDKGYWNQIEAYVSDHSEAEFSHSICPECRKELYPDLKNDNY